MAIVMNFAERIVIDPDVCNGRPSVRGTRIAVESVLEYLGAGDNEADIIAAMPQLELADVRACINSSLPLVAEGLSRATEE